MTNPGTAIVNSVGIYSSGFEAKQDTARRYLMIASGAPDKNRHCRASSNALKIRAPGRAPNQSSTAILRGGPIYRLFRLE